MARAMHIEFKEMGYPTCPFGCIFSVPNFENEAACIKFIEEIINAQLSDHVRDSEHFE